MEVYFSPDAQPKLISIDHRQGGESEAPMIRVDQATVSVSLQPKQLVLTTANQTFEKSYLDETATLQEAGALGLFEDAGWSSERKKVLATRVLVNVDELRLRGFCRKPR